MSKMKMSDHFDLPVSFDVDLCKIHSPSHNLIEAKAISLDAQCHAINNHDRMMEEIAELKDKVDELRKDKFQLIDAAEYLHEKLIKEGKRYGASINRKMISKLLAKLNQEGEE